ncbi:hypothetical protein MSG28_010162 [Choristoneura fumiferana]|uniref:Uncharacterized protein n=1 Tax=Choristoneura fumiferana TaxID=7141 RepID=A0ACC0KJY4_CHOFU|nr:hypothetical protein MSG28_010162 [Choristoneura fumiferana]
MSDFGGPGPSSGGTGRRAKGSRGRGRGSGRHPGGLGGPGDSGYNRSFAGPRAASQPPRSRGSQHHQRHTSNPGPGLLGAYVPPSAIHGHQTSQKDARRDSKKKTNKERPMGFRMLEQMSQSNSVDIIERISQQKKSFTLLLETPVEKEKQDVFALVLQIITNLSKTSFEESMKVLLLEICNSKFIDHLQLYLTQLPYCKSDLDKSFNGYYWKKQTEFWGNFMSFSELIINVSPSTAVRKCGSLIEATSKICLEGLKAKHGFELPEEYVERMTRIRDSLTTYENEPKAKKRRIDCTANEMGEPPESFRELSILPTPEELIADRPFLRPNVVKGAYVDKEHYLDVQFRLLREDCFGPLREGIHQFIKEPNKKKYDHIRVYRNVKFLEPFVSNQKIGSLVLLDENTMKRFKNIEWAHSKRFLFGSLVLFTNDNCKSFLIGTILDRDEKYLSKRQLAVSLVDTGTELKIYNDDSYTMIECEVYFEPYYHVLKALQDPNFPEHLAMSSYIIDVQKMPEKPAYLSPDTVFSVLTEENMTCDVTVLEEETWPSETTLGLNSTQYEAYKLALTHEFAVIQGPPGTGKTFLGVKIAQTLLRNLNIRILVICYTNHALDQFLEALLPVTKSMVRIGGRSRNEALQKFNINEIRRQNDIWFSNFHDKRINLKMEMGELKRAQARLDELMYASVLSCKSIVEHVEECKIIENFYRGSGIEDPLYHWLFEDMDNIEFEPLVEANHILEYDASSGINENRDVDDDNRNDVIFDDLDVHDHEVHMRDFPLVETSFTISDAKENVKKLFKMLEQLQTKGPAHKNKCDLRGEICHIFSQMKRLKDMMAYRTRAPKINLRYVQDITNVPLIERWSLYFKWTEVVLLDFKKIIKMQEKKVKSAAEAYDEARMIVDLAVLKKAEVVGMTTSGAARLRKLMAEIETPIGPQHSVLRAITPTPLLDRNLDTNFSYAYTSRTTGAGRERDRPLYMAENGRHHTDGGRGSGTAREGSCAGAAPLASRHNRKQPLVEGSRVRLYIEVLIPKMFFSPPVADPTRSLCEYNEPRGLRVGNDPTRIRPLLVVEEAAEVLEAHIVTSLTKHCQHLILIGMPRSIALRALSLACLRAVTLAACNEISYNFAGRWPAMRPSFVSTRTLRHGLRQQHPQPPRQQPHNRATSLCVPPA